MFYIKCQKCWAEKFLNTIIDLHFVQYNTSEPFHSGKNVYLSFNTICSDPNKMLIYTTPVFKPDQIIVS